MHSATRKFKNFKMTGSDKVIKSLQEVNPQFPTDLVTFIEEILNGKLHFLCSVRYGRVLTLLLQEKRDNLPLPLMSCES